MDPCSVHAWVILAMCATGVWVREIAENGTAIVPYHGPLYPKCMIFQGVSHLKYGSHLQDFCESDSTSPCSHHLHQCGLEAIHKLLLVHLLKGRMP